MNSTNSTNSRNLQMEMKLHDFLTKFGPILQKRVEERLHPIYNPREEDPIEDFQGLLRRPYPAQAHAAKAIYQALQSLPSVYLVGEMGTGKTMISISLVHLFLVPQRVLIMAPSHLVSKWEREVKDTIAGAKVIVLRELRTLLAMRERKQEKPTTHEFYILSKERAKLHHGWRTALGKKKVLIQTEEKKRLGFSFICFDCGKEIENPKLDKKQKCPHCKSALWQAIAPRRYAFAEYIKKYLNKGYFDLLIADECQKYKGATAQGLALGELASSAKKTILLTGTLMGGYAHNLFNLLWRSHTQEMKEKGFSHASETRFQQGYGFIERTYREVIGEEKDYQWSRAKRRSVNVKPIPGINPLILPHFLLPNAVFLRLSDVAEALPPYEERVVSLAMNPAQAREYWEVEAELKEIVKRCLIRGSKRALAPYLQGLLMLPDAIYRQNEITADGTVLVNSPVEGIVPKEAELLEIVKKEKAQRRKVLVYINYTDTRDITPRLQRLLEEKGYRVGILRSGETERREEILEGLVKKGADVVITNPALVETGLDLYDFPSVVFYEAGYSTYLLRQASRRSWRIGQKEPVTVYFLCYEETMQEKALRLIASKLETSLVIEGELSDSGLQALSRAQGSMEIELARALLGGLDDRESLTEAWAKWRKREVEVDLAGPEKEIKVRDLSKAISQIGNRLVTVEVIEVVRPRKKKVMRLTVTEGDLEALAKEKGPLQLALF